MRPFLRIGLAASLAASALFASSSPAQSAAPEPAPAASTTPAGITCDTITPRTGGNFEICTHGPDQIGGLPPVDTAALAPPDLNPAATEGIKCYGDGTSGMRVQAVYALPPGVSDRSAEAFPQIEGYAKQVEEEVSASAARTGGVRHVRWVTSPHTSTGCDLDILKVRLTDPDVKTGTRAFIDTIVEMLEVGHDRSDRVYLIWMETDLTPAEGAICGVGNIILDDRPLSLNANAYGIRFTRVDRPCWGIAETHELGHNLGAVQRSAPHSTPFGHCTDEYDLMCYEDGPGVAMNYENSCSNGVGGTNPCADPLVKRACYGTGDITEGIAGPGTLANRLWDCNNDDYFHTGPTGANYLVTHWNIANHPALARTDSTDASGQGAFRPLPTPVRLVDTRLANKGLIWDIGRDPTIAPTHPSEALTFGTGRLKTDYHYVVRATGFDSVGGALTTPQTITLPSLGVPLVGVAAVALNVTVIDPSTAGFLSIRPYNYELFDKTPTVSNINYDARQVIPNAVTITVPGDGMLDIYTSAGNPFIIIDVAGWYADGSGAYTTKGSFHELTPTRIMDTRRNFGGATLNTATTAALKVTGESGVPETNVAGVVLNVTVADAQTTSFLTAWPSGQPRPNASNLNYTAGPAVANLVIVGVGADGRVNFFNETGRANLIVDILGWFDTGHASSPPGSTYRAISPARVVDTRTITPPALGPAATRHFLLRAGGVPNTAAVKAVIANVAAVSPTIGGYLTTFPTGQTMPGSSTVNFGPNANRANQAFITLAADGRASVFNERGSTHVLVDVSGYFTT